MIEFEESFNRFALYQNGFVFCILTPDKPTVHDQKNLIILTDSEIVRVHGVKKFTMTEEVKRINPTTTKLDENVINRKGAFKNAKPDQLNKPFEVKFTPNIQISYTEEILTTIFCNEEGEMFPIPSNLPSDEQATLAKLMKAHFVLARFRVESKLLPKASPHRSQGKI